MAIQYVTSIHDIAAPKALLLIDVCLQAYRAFDKHSPAECKTESVLAPAGFDLVECWTGVDSIFSEGKTVECYGVVFRSKVAPYTYLFGFRGTSSPLDVVDDLGALSKQFTPFDSSVQVPSSVGVESGFFDVYTERTQETVSMQSQLFAMVDACNASDKPIDQLYITGHSLGASLATLFTLDIALCRPHVAASCYNFASPRVGNPDFVAFYGQQEAQRDPATRTVRVQNTYDKIPCVPPEDIGYEHLPYAYLLAFYKDDWIGKLGIVDCHSSLNYNAVLSCAAASKDGVCLNKKLEVPANGYAVTSEKPDPASVCHFW